MTRPVLYTSECWSRLAHLHPSEAPTLAYYFVDNVRAALLDDQLDAREAHRLARAAMRLGEPSLARRLRLHAHALQYEGGHTNPDLLRTLTDMAAALELHLHSYS